MPSLDDYAHAHALIDLDEPSTRIASANYLLSKFNLAPDCESEQAANALLQGALQALLDHNFYAAAAALCWGRRLFDARPRFVRQIWHGLMTQNKFLVMGCGAGGKSYSTMAWALLDYARDPLYTTIKIISTTAGHERAQTFSTLVRFHRASVVPLPGFIRQGFIGLDKDDRRSSIAEVAIEKGAEGKGTKLQGFHPLPRPKAHPILGEMSRVVAILDEAEGIPNGVWEGVANLLTSKDATNSVRVIALTNPRRRDSQFAVRAEPLNGWRDFDLENSVEWESKLGWHVLRLDGKRCENVEERRVIYHGLITYDGYVERLNEGGDDEYTFARGAYPIQSISYNIIPVYLLDNARGHYLWSSKTPTNIGALDPAFEADGDKAKFTAALYGEALGFTPEGGSVRMFPRPRYVIQVEQQFDITKQNSEYMCRDVISIAKALHIRPEWFVMDRSGNATGLHDLLSLRYGHDALGLMWGQASTEVPILEEDRQPASELYDDLVTEMYFAFARWLEFGYIAFAPMMQTAEMFAQFTARKYKPIGKIKRRMYSKKDYMKDTGRQSPDASDSVVMLVHLARQRARSGEEVATMEPRKVRPIEAVNDYMRSVGGSNLLERDEVDVMEYVDTK
jgi:hypothetical protein